MNREQIIEELMSYLEETGDDTVLRVALIRTVKRLSKKDHRSEALATHFDCSTRQIYRLLAEKEPSVGGTVELLERIRKSLARRPKSSAELSREVKVKPSSLLPWLQFLFEQGKLTATERFCEGKLCITWSVSKEKDPRQVTLSELLDEAGHAP